MDYALEATGEAALVPEIVPENAVKVGTRTAANGVEQPFCARATLLAVFVGIKGMLCRTGRSNCACVLRPLAQELVFLKLHRQILMMDHWQFRTRC
ncbi:hypothetical protein MRX96_007990 [Rhipicephalus microplus]